MSDLLLMRGSPLRQILSTPGLVACYLPYLQVAQSLTGQTLLDYSPAGNHAQLGSTAGADTNDPSWGTNALTFGGDDYVLMPSLGFGDITAFTAFRVDADVAQVAPTIWGRNNMKLYAEKGSTNLILLFVNTDVVNKLIIATGVLPKDTWVLSVVSLSTAGVGYVSVSPVVSPSATGFALHPSNSGSGTRIGLDLASRYFEGDVVSHVVFNRVLSVGEVSRNWYALKTLLAGQGVSVS